MPGIRWFAAAVVAAVASNAHAEFIEVELFDDRPDADLTDGVCDADLATPGEQHTLRAAIQHANVTPGSDTVSLKAGKYKLKIKGSGEDACATGDLDITDEIVLLGPSSATCFIDGRKAKDRIFDVQPGVAALIFCVTVTGGKTVGDVAGAGVRNRGELDLHDVIVTKCKSGGDAGGIHHAGGTAALSNVWVTKCKSADGAGGIGVDAAGFSMSNSTISKCKAGNEGGGLEFSGNEATLTNVTISGNKAPSEGGGISLEDAGTLHLVHCTIALNKAPSGAGIAFGGPETCDATNTIFSRNAPANSDRPLTSLGGNIDSGTSCGFGAGDLSSTDPKLAKLAFAQTEPPPAVPTHALPADSAALGFAAANCPFGDARNVPRTAPCDSGAFELP